jgi:D-aminopeptidase
MASKRAVRLRFGHSAETLALRADGSAAGGGTTLRPVVGGLLMDRESENVSTVLHPCRGIVGVDMAGRYRCAELEADITVADAGGALYGAFSGFLGQGRMELLHPVGPDVWALPCPRALDPTPPGDWTLAFRRDDAGRVAGLEVGCWLARRLPYERIG